MNTTNQYDIHRCDLPNLARVLDTFKCGTIRLWNWDNPEPGKNRYIAVRIKIPNLGLHLNYYAGSATGGEAEAWLKEAEAWVNDCTSSVHQQVLGEKASEMGWSVERAESS